MKYSDDIKSYDLDLTLPPRELWRDVIAADSDTARRLFQTGWTVAEEQVRMATHSGLITRMLLGLVPSPIAMFYKLSKGRYVEEINAWADALKLDRSLMIFMQCMYELSHLGPKGAAVLGCSAGVKWIENVGLVHVRTLDWNVEGMGEATRLFNFHKDNRRFTVVGMPGLVGALSGMVPGGFSATINWAPPATNPFFYFGPLFQLRHVLETCDTYKQAVDLLTTTRFSTSVFFTVCGVQREEACVIEYIKTSAWGGRQCRMRRIENSPITQSNHYQHPDFAGYNGAVDTKRSALLSTSRERAATLSDLLAGARAKSPGDLLSVLNVYPVENDETRQKMIFCPARGEVKVWREV